MNGYLASLIVREMQIKITMWYHLTSTRVAFIKKTTENKCWPEGGRKRTLDTVDGNGNSPGHYGKQNEISSKKKKKKKRTTTKYKTPTKYILNDTKSLSQGDTCILMLTEILFIITKIWKQLCPNNGWMDDMLYIQWNSIHPWIRGKSCYLQQWNLENIQFSSVAQPCPTLCDPLDCNFAFSYC